MFTELVELRFSTDFFFQSRARHTTDPSKNRRHSLNIFTPTYQSREIGSVSQITGRPPLISRGEEQKSKALWKLLPIPGRAQLPDFAIVFLGRNFGGDKTRPPRKTYPMTSFRFFQKKKSRWFVGIFPSQSGTTTASWYAHPSRKRAGTQKTKKIACLSLFFKNCVTLFFPIFFQKKTSLLVHFPGMIFPPLFGIDSGVAQISSRTISEMRRKLLVLTSAALCAFE